MRIRWFWVTSVFKVWKIKHLRNRSGISYIKIHIEGNSYTIRSQTDGWVHWKSTVNGRSTRSTSKLHFSIEPYETKLVPCQEMVHTRAKMWLWHFSLNQNNTVIIFTCISPCIVQWLAWREVILTCFSYMKSKGYSARFIPKIKQNT